MTDVIRASDTRDLVATATAVLGFTPTESLVVICLKGERNRVGMVMRADLASLTGADAAATIGAQVRRQADAAVVLVYSDDPAARRRGYAAASGALLGLPVPRALWVSTTAYGSLDCPDTRCCPAEGWPLGEVEASVVRAETTMRGQTITATREALLPAPATPAARREAEAARLAWITEHGQAADTGDTEADDTRAHAALFEWTRPFITGRDADTYGRLAAVLSVPTWRDLVLAFVVTQGEACDLSDASRVAFERMFTVAPGAEPLRPSTMTLPAEVSLLLRTAAHTSGTPAAHAYATAAVLAWWSGDGATANLAVDAAIEADGANSLALLTRDVLANGMAPAWTTATD